MRQRLYLRRDLKDYAEITFNRMKWSPSGCKFGISGLDASTETHVERCLEIYNAPFLQAADIHITHIHAP